MKLGQRVAAIRATGKYIEEDIQRRKVLDDLGFLWRLRAPSPDTGTADTTTFDQIYSALVTYKQEILDKQDSSSNPVTHMHPEDDDEEEEESSSSFHIPRNFVVPNYAPWPEETQGLPLGKMLSTIRSKAFLKANPDAEEKLQSLGFELDGKAAANEAKFVLVYKALATYKQIYGDLLVPQPFVIPAQSKDWPEETWDLRLGARVNAIRSQGTFIKTHPDRKELLNDLGFEWETSTVSKAPGAKKKGRKRKETDPEEEEESFGEQSQPSNEFEDDMELNEPIPTSLLQYPGASIINSKMGSFIENDDDGESTDYKEEDEDLIMEDDEEDALLPPYGSAIRDSRTATMMKEPPTVTPQRSDEDYQAPKDLNATLTAAAEMAMAVGVIESLGYVHNSIVLF